LPTGVLVELYLTFLGDVSMCRLCERHEQEEMKQIEK
jgi:hypothetical protein